MADSILPEAQTRNNSENSDKSGVTSSRGRSSSRKRPLSNSDEQMKPPASRHRSQSVSKHLPADSEQVTFKTQGQSFNMNKLIENTFLKQEVLDSVIPQLMNNIKSDLMSEFKTVITAAVTEAIENAVKRLRNLVEKQDQRIKDLENENQQLKLHCENQIKNVEARYEKFRNLANAHATLLSENQKFKENITLLNEKIEDLEQYGLRTSLQFHNVPMTSNELQKTDSLIVKIANEKLKLTPPLCENDINRSHIIGNINSGKAQLICRFRNWKVKNNVYMAKRNLFGNEDNIFSTEDLTKFRQSIIKELSTQKKSKRIHYFWTFDGRIFVKKTEDSAKVLVKCIDEVKALIEG